MSRGNATDRTFALIDLAGFTALTEAMGDEEAAGIAERFAAMSKDCLGRGDYLVKTIGDAVLLASDDPRSGLRLIGRLLDRVYGEANFPIPRAGVHHGSAVERGGDFFGSAINLTARVAAQAFGGQVLATAAVAEEARALGIVVFQPHGTT